MALRDGAGSLQNEAGTGSRIDTPATRAGSPIVHGWRPRSTAPMDGTKFLGVTKSGRMKVDWIDASLHTSQFAHERGDDGYTHWMPLPEPPQ